jgi:alkylation response protein AidB-like acyl-CoA dehydrogenase
MTTTAAPPADLVAAAHGLGPTLRAASDEAERIRHCPPHVVEALHESRLLDMITPRAYGGLEEGIPTMVRVLEELAIHDASVAWVVGIANGTAIISGTLAPEEARRLFVPRAVAGGAQAPYGRARREDGGWRVSGRWPFASGCTHCTVLVGGCLLEGGDRPVPEYRLAVFPIEDVEIIDTWHVAGLRGTGSRDMHVSDVFVPEARMLALGTTRPHVDGPTYRYPVLGFLALTIAPIPLGIARRAIDEVVALAESKRSMGIGPTLRDKQTAQHEIGRAEAILRSARAWMYEVTGEIWEKAVAGRPITPEDRAMVRAACAHASLEAVRVAEIAYRLAGGSAIYESNALQRCLRDANTATQHVQLTDANYEPAGRALFGLDVGPMV